jgi:hypothetical protein
MALTQQDLDSIRQIFREELTSVGIDVEHPLEAQADQRHLRRWREISESGVTRAVLTAVGVLVTGLVGAVLASFRPH